MLNFFATLASWLFPRPPLIEELCTLSAESLRHRALPPARMRLPALEEWPMAVTAILHYRQPLVRQAMWELKYRGDSKVAALFAELAAAELEKILAQTPKPAVVIPLPSSAARRRKRGWNQTELIASRVKLYMKNYSDRLFVRPGLLCKTRNPPPQATLGNRARLTNLQNCFALDKKLKQTLPADPLIILLDDVTTTGATFAEAARPLFAAGYRDVYCLAIAH
jgi:ComF family protein